ncbi:unnamed protein product [Urochloa humidicola]
MAHYQEVDYSSEEVVARPAGLFGRHGGVQQHIVKEEKFEEVDKVGHGHHGRRGHGSGHFEARESKFEEDMNTRTGEFHERKEKFAVRAD